MCTSGDDECIFSKKGLNSEKENILRDGCFSVKVIFMLWMGFDFNN